MVVMMRPNPSSSMKLMLMRAAGRWLSMRSVMTAVSILTKMPKGDDEDGLVDCKGDAKVG